MKTKILALILITLSLFALVACGGGENNDNGETLGALYSKGLEYKVVEGNPSQCIITGVGTCTDKDIKIPPTIDGKTVVGIDDGAFANRTISTKSTRKMSARDGIQIDSSFISGGITLAPTQSEDQGVSSDEIESVTIPLTVKEIGDEAFLDCESLETINSSQNITSIGKDAFTGTAYYNNEQNWEGEALYLNNCLISVSTDFQGEFVVKEGTTLIADQAFYQCVNLTNVNFAESVSIVGNYAFYGCSSLTYVAGSTEISYGNYVFEGCFSYTQAVPGLGGNPVTPPSQDNSGLYQEIDADIFEAIKKFDFNSQFSAETVVTEDGQETIITYTVYSYGFHYTYKVGDEIQTELYGMTEEGTTTIYMRKNEKWYLTTAPKPDFHQYYIPEELEFDMLTVFEEKTGRYAYTSEDGSARIVMGFKANKAEYVGYFADGFTMETTYSYSNLPNLPDYSNADLIEGIVLDQNGDVIHEDA